MPMYEYACADCESRFDRIVPSARADEQTCPRCESARVRRLISVIAGPTGLAEAPAAPTCGAGACGAC